jgi:sarcosine oxidase gamma subunit
MNATANPRAGWRLDVLAAARVLEVVALAALPDAPDCPQFPRLPGGGVYDAAGDPLLLHFAPRRWLVTGTGPSVDAALAAVPAFGVQVDVTGKWQGFRISGAGAQRLLASALAVETVLAGRHCAALTLFDCPAVLAHAQGGYVAWVQASYAAHLVGVVAGLAGVGDGVGDGIGDGVSDGSGVAAERGSRVPGR